ncbi:nucleotidyl transferase AbiEii/AbiGii toxin family protein [Longimicrobium sp.]|uniref:nucleotidyl transferase AbiEii/AbiGii toxin family protein n=1 Tax=Longimicrobium sp. TaxID=2029185 RepID=UPI002E323AC5|nr:nucleotidyl transferase AbiEii/AbiGii toxin family protein [Longimicrobium sp.]HEX6038848.1 nucleotidyl transferase AbiEii/AbiGii toxin family protein [Longimicrobium sp.]
MTKPVRPPASERTLTRYVVAYARRADADVARVRRLVSFMALAGALRQARREEDGGPAFVVKGGVALELRLRNQARATRDMDLILNRDGGDLLLELEDLLASPYEAFTFRRKGREHRMLNGAVRVKVQVSYMGREWGTVEVDVARREGETEVELVPGLPLLQEFGLTGPDDVECLSLRHHVAQKLHGMTLPMPEGRQNERFRDLVDLLLLRQFIEDHTALASACADVFARRGTHAWPPALVPPEEWREPFARMASETDLPIQELDAAVSEIREWIALIASASPS